MVQRERILVTVRTYPTPSAGNRETVCTGGITDSREWRRLYPVPLRYLPEAQRFKTWDVIEVDVRAARRDNRPESRCPHLPMLKVSTSIKSWKARCEWVEPTCHLSLQAMIDAGRSLGPVVVTEVLDLIARQEQPIWDPRRKAKLEQMMLFDDPLPLEKVPYQFRFIWRDADGEERDSLVISWEMAQTWRNYRKGYSDPIGKMKEKLLGDYFGPQRAPKFFMGNHSRFRNTFMVCGWFVPLRDVAGDAYLW